MIPVVTIYVRHSRNCPYHGDEFCKRCKCRKHLRYSLNGRQHRLAVKTRSWAAAEQARRTLEMRIEEGLAGTPTRSQDLKTVEDAIDSFITAKTGADKSSGTISKYKLTLRRLSDYCARKQIYFIGEIRQEHLEELRVQWHRYFHTAFGLRNEQSRVRAFFRYCFTTELILRNPASALEAIKVTDEDYKANPFTEAEVETESLQLSIDV